VTAGPAKPDLTNADSAPLSADGAHVGSAPPNSPDARQVEVVREFMAVATGIAANPLHQKLTAEHITQAMTLAAQHDEREFELARQEQTQTHQRDLRERWTHIIYLGLLVLAVLFLSYRFHDQPQVLTPILTGLGGGIAGFIGGLGYAGRSRD
jgi:hypothetical protein